MSGWLEFGKLCLAFMSGAGLIWLREWLAERGERKRKQSALWKACAVESEAVLNDFAQIRWIRERVIQGAGISGGAYVHTATSKLAERLIELDPKNAEPYLALIMRCGQLIEKAGTLSKELDAAARATEAERKSGRGLVESALNQAARMLVLHAEARLRILRVLRGNYDDPRIGAVIASAEQDAHMIAAEQEAWENEYAAKISRAKELLALKAARENQG